jgi:hypothetical protein
LESLEDRSVPSSFGSLDGTFGQGGLVTTSIGINSAEVRALVLQPDGKLVAAATVTTATLTKISRWPATLAAARWTARLARAAPFKRPRQEASPLHRFSGWPSKATANRRGWASVGFVEKEQ